MPVASLWGCFVSDADAGGGHGRGVAGASWRMLAGCWTLRFDIASSSSPLRSRAGALVLFIGYFIFLVCAALVHPPDGLLRRLRFSVFLEVVVLVRCCELQGVMGCCR